MSERLTPDPAPLFDAIRDHLKASRAAGFMLHDKAGGYYVAVGRSPEAIVDMVAAGPERMTPYNGSD